MSTKIARNLMATALVAIALFLGCLVGYFAFGGQPTPTEAVVPSTETVCTLCIDNGGSGGGGNIGNTPPALDNTVGGLGGATSGGSGSIG